MRGNTRNHDKKEVHSSSGRRVFLSQSETNSNLEGEDENHSHRRRSHTELSTSPSRNSNLFTNPASSSSFALHSSDDSHGSSASRNGNNNNHVEDANHRSRLFHSDENGNKKEISILSSSPSSKDGKRREFKNPTECDLSLLKAAKEGNLEHLKHFIEEGGNINMGDAYGSTALHFCSLQGNEEAVNILLDNENCLVNCTDFLGRSPIFYAAKIGNANILQRLVEMGGDVKIKPENGETPLMKSSQNGHFECIRIILKEESFEGGREELLRYLNENDTHLFTALHYAALKGHTNCLKWLLQNGADINPKNTHGETPLHLSVLYKKIECAKLLVDFGASVETKNNSGKSPIDDAGFDKNLATYLKQTSVNNQLNGLKQKELTSWTPLEVAKWLSLLGFSQYRDIFIHNSVSGTSLMTLTVSSLKAELNVASYGHRTSIMEQIKKLQKEMEERKLVNRSRASNTSQGQYPSEIAECNTIEYNSLIMQELLGKGFFGEVKKALWKGTEVAVKVLYRVENEQVFFKELGIIQKLRHPNIIMFLGASLDGENRCIITEYLSGGNVHRLIHNDWIILEKNVMLRYRIAMDVIRGMTYLHDLKIVHRDLTPKNLLLDTTYTCKVCDFGLSRIKEDSGSLTTSLGCLPYQAPEVFRGRRYTEKSDVFSFGMVLYELLSGEEPHKGREPLRFANMVAFEDFRPPLPDVPGFWMDLITKCWSVDPDKRPSFKDLLKELSTTAETSRSPPPLSPSDECDMGSYTE
eukprot:TRINITY_DN6541_c0_g1_i1.p1 TRINITY_DN6541_c0_g1~~TRINITY_DN6541_c0_g1_i1.p1  ORF type:complete len:754 (-),score=232.36 TRINITY_DN6541_c0_g1_i1:129-2390(-)